MNATFASVSPLILNPLTLAGLVLVAGLIVTRLPGREKPSRTSCSNSPRSPASRRCYRSPRCSRSSRTAAMGLALTFVTVSVFKIVWWLAASWLLAGFVRAVLAFKRSPEETRFLQDLCAGAIYVCAVLGIIADVFDVPISGLLAASGLIAIVLGLALQSTLGDVFSGVALNLSKPYRPGDWIILDSGMAGRVIETNWRATHLLNL